MDTPRRSIAKALSWRLLATTITTGLVYLLTGKGEFAFALALGTALLSLALLVNFLILRLHAGRPLA